MSEKTDAAPYGGPLGSTTRAKTLVTDDVGDAFPVELVRSINVRDDPGLLAQLHDGTLHRVKAPDGSEFDLAVPVVCHDPQRAVLALVIPQQLRWDELRLRNELTQELFGAGAPLPAYARRFHVIIGSAGLDALEGASTVISENEVTQIASKSHDDLEVSKELARKRSELETEANRIEVERAQLTDVRQRFDKERDQLDIAQAEVARARAELAQMRDALEMERQQFNAEQLNREGAALRKAQTGTSETTENTEPVKKKEGTQVVTDDQFIEVVDVSDVFLAAADSVVELDVDDVVIAEIRADVPEDMSSLVTAKRQKAVKLINDRILAMALVDQKLVDALFGDTPRFFVQMHQVDGYPVVALLLATLDERAQIKEHIAWTLDPAPDGDRLVLERLRERTKLRAAFYDKKGKRLHAVEIVAPFSANVAWILERSAELLGKSGRVDYPTARDKFEDDVPKLGTMRHNFERDSFADASTASKVKLAAGIVGYWSKPDTFEYLIANRCFPLQHFKAIQRRVAQRAARAGIFMNKSLRKVALEMDLAPNEGALVELLIANFAEASISIRESDLDPADQWDNWDALLGLGEELGIPPDPDVVELAEVSLKRAQDAEELVEESTRTVEDPRPNRPPNVHDALVVSKNSDSTGVTYFLPSDAVLDTFDDLAEMPRADLERLLNDANGRLEAAQMLIERYSPGAAATAIAAAASMSAPEVAALARFVETKHDKVAPALMKSLKSDDPGTKYVAVRGLAAAKNADAIDPLLELLADAPSGVDVDQFAHAVAGYGEALLPALYRAIKRDGTTDPLISVLGALEEHAPGTLATMSKDRSKNLREAARLARQQRESRSA